MTEPAVIGSRGGCPVCGSADAAVAADGAVACPDCDGEADTSALLANAIAAKPSVDAVEAALAALVGVENAAAAETPLLQLEEALRGAGLLKRRIAREQAIAALRMSAKLNAPAKIVDAALGKSEVAGDSEAGTVLVLADPQPWPVPVDGAELLNDLVASFARYAVLAPHAAEALALWALFTHALDAAHTAPILALTSPEKRCGKSTVLGILAQLVRRPLPASNISPAAVFRSIEKWNPTLLIDEGDSFLRDNEELRGVLNSGHTRAAAYVVRCFGEDLEPRQFSTWGAKAVALIGRLADTLEDRSIEVRLRRKLPGETVAKLRPACAHELVELRQKAARWSTDHLATLRDAEPVIPAAMHDRAGDNWSALLAIADVAGGQWPERARRAALKLSGIAEADSSNVREQLLADVRDVLDEADAIFSAELLAGLVNLDGRPWGDWRGGRAMTPRQLADQLRPFDVRPRDIRRGVETAKGYRRVDLEDAFRRYLSPLIRDCRDNASGAGRCDALEIRDAYPAVADREMARKAGNTEIVTVSRISHPLPDDLLDWDPGEVPEQFDL